MKAPSFFSVTLLLIFVILINFDFDEIDPLCLRKIESHYHWNLFLPIYSTLIFVSLVEGYKSFKNAKTEFLTLICLAPILVPFVIFLFNVMYSFITI